SLLALLPSENEHGIRRTALVFALVELAISLGVAARFEAGVADFQLVERAAWIPAFGIEYPLGLGGVGLFPLPPAAFLTPIVILAAWGDVHRRAKEYYVLFLFLETAMVGALLALDLFLFYVFWELMLIPMYLLIGVWGGPRRIYAAMKFVLFTMVGS